MTLEKVYEEIKFSDETDTLIKEVYRFKNNIGESYWTDIFRKQLYALDTVCVYPILHSKNTQLTEELYNMLDYTNRANDESVKEKIDLEISIVYSAIEECNEIKEKYDILDLINAMKNYITKIKSIRDRIFNEGD